ncbi:hypothetical protein SDC9_198874 [bioreactor metagenome]|uniref:Uncharacterized protein n=1 Tax=bioreactor metagenome TaxID=1076179 RepID=A0A645IK40_9ZZZZ
MELGDNVETAMRAVDEDHEKRHHAEQRQHDQQQPDAKRGRTENAMFHSLYAPSFLRIDLYAKPLITAIKRNSTQEMVAE